MMYAAQIGHLDLIKALIGKNVPLTSLSADTGYNCLMVALQAAKYDLIYQISDYFMNSKPFNQQCRDYGETLLMKALAKNLHPVARALLSKPGIQLGLKDRMGKTELIHAVERNSPECTRLLIESGKALGLDVDMNNYDKRGRTALIHAVINQSCEILELLLNTYEFPLGGGAHVIRWKDELGKDACDYAQMEEVKVLLAMYIEEKSMLFPGYFEMMRTIHKRVKKESYLAKVEQERKYHVLDPAQVKRAAREEQLRRKTLKNKIKRIEDEIEAENEKLKVTDKD